MNAPRWRTALITGASSGIGTALAKRLARDGTEVVLAARRRALLDEHVAAIVAAGGRASAVEIDVTRPDETVATIRRIDATLGGIDLVIANAGIGRPQRATTLSWEKVSNVCATNFTGSIATLTAVLPEMVARGRGHLVGISSVAVYAPTPAGSAYRATKAGLTAFLENLRCELGDTGLGFTAVHPGFVQTPLADAFTVKPPVIVSAEAAAEVIVSKLAGNPARIDFPLSVVGMIKTMGALPAFVRDPIVRRMQLGDAD